MPRLSGKSKFQIQLRNQVNAVLSLRWDDVDFERGQLTIGATGDTKNKSARVVDFNPKLKAHLLDMSNRQSGRTGKPVSQWLFPSPQRGEKDIHSETFRESHKMARVEAKLPKAGFHDLRHFFISFAVMAGIDYMTIAKWLAIVTAGSLSARFMAIWRTITPKPKHSALTLGRFS